MKFTSHFFVLFEIKLSGITFSRTYRKAVSGRSYHRSLCERTGEIRGDKNSGGQSEEHYRGEKMRGDTREEMREDKDIKWE